MHRRFALTTLLSFVLLAMAAWSWAGEVNDPEKSFRSPDIAARPWAYWWWLNANVDRQSITRDLEGMKEKGLAGCLLFDVTAYGQAHVPSPPRRVQFMSPEWRALVKHALTEADRLGLKMSINLSTSGGALRAPWKAGEHAPKALLWSSADVDGGRRIACRLPALSEPRLWDVALLAARLDGPQASPAAAGGAAEIDLGGQRDAWRQAMWEPDRNTVAGEVVDLTAQLDAQRQLTWEVPAGRWRLLRFAYTITEGSSDFSHGSSRFVYEQTAKTESDIDMLDPRAVESHFNRFAGALMEDAGPLVGKTLSHFYSVSWEGAIPTWTPRLDDQFEKYRGYSLRPYLPVMAGITVRDAEVSARFLRDFCRTLSDCFMNNCYGKIGELCHRAGLQWHSEAGGPWQRKTPLFAHADALAFWGRNDMPQGEFWWPGKPGIRRVSVPMAANSARLYGRPLVAVEAFTHMQPHWSAYPATLKLGADATFCDGANWFLWHTFSASPREFGQPGIVYFAGTHLNPNVTWWPEAGGILRYLARCQTLLRQGRTVVDVCAYRTDRNYAAPARLPGYAVDLVNTEVLVSRLAVADGDLVLPDGMRYRVLYLDPEQDEPLPPEALRKIIELARNGATVALGSVRPQRAPGLKDYPACDEEVRRLATELWGEGKGPSRRGLGKGTIVRGETIEQVLAARGILPDCVGPTEFIHRKTAERDVYFVAGQGPMECTFRVTGKEPELWDAVTGKFRDAVMCRAADDGRTTVPLNLPEYGSVFVVFRKPSSAKRLVSWSGAEGGLEIVERSPRGATVRLWKNGAYTLDASPERRIPVVAKDLPRTVTLTGPWQVRFAPGGGGPDSAVFESLVAWDQHADPRIRYFSGTATYRRVFELDARKAAGLVRLDLGEVKHVARVRVNGKDLGAVWTSPWTVDLTGAVRPGENQLEIDVTNVWANRLIGDAALPPEKRLTKTNVRLEQGQRTVKPYEGYGSTDPLIPSGLIGPVRLEFGEERELEL